MAQPTPAQRMEHVIRTYIQACVDCHRLYALKATRHGVPTVVAQGFRPHEE